MIITNETKFENFEPWSGAEYTFDAICYLGKAREMEQLIEELYPDGIDETTLNDLLWFEDEWLYEQLGIHSWDLKDFEEGE